jgi:hypothetical protein
MRSDASNAPTPGTSAPLGATPAPGGANFSVFSRHATRVELLLFDHVDYTQPSRVIRVDPTISRTHHRTPSATVVSWCLRGAIGAFSMTRTIGRSSFTARIATGRGSMRHGAGSDNGTPYEGFAYYLVGKEKLS